MLLQEYRQFKVDKLLVERSIKENKPLMVSGIIQRAEAKNQNGRIYPKDILEREIKKYAEGPVKERRAMGELDHPESSVINLQNVSHTVKDCWWDGDDVQDDFELLCFDFVSTPSTHGAFMSPVGGLNEETIRIPEYKYNNVNNIIRDIICDNTGVCKC